MKLRIIPLIFCLLIAIQKPQTIIATTLQKESNGFSEGLNNTSYFQTPQGHQLRYTHFKSKNAKGEILFLQGRATFLELYEVLIVPLLERGFNVWMYDLSGQGGSDRLLDYKKHDQKTVNCMQHIDSFHVYTNDAIAFINEIVIPKAKGDLILGGYSTGGHIALRILQSLQEHPFKKAFLTSPLLGFKAPFSNQTASTILWLVSLIMDLKIYWPGTGPTDPIFTTPFHQNKYTTDEKKYLTLQNLNHQYRNLLIGGVSIGWIKSAFDSLCLLWQKENIQAIDIPIFIATAGRDTVVDVSYNQKFVNLLSKGVHGYYPEGLHEIFRENQVLYQALWDDFDRFIENEFEN